MEDRTKQRDFEPFTPSLIHEIHFPCIYCSFSPYFHTIYT